jgi:hypothetical protein
MNLYNSSPHFLSPIKNPNAMRKKILNILAASFLITTIGYLADKDVKEPNMLMRIIEFFGMIGIVFFLISIFYFTFYILKKKIQRLH